VAFDEEAAAMLDAQTGERKSPATYTRTTPTESNVYGQGFGVTEKGFEQFGYGDTGGTSRFFYTAKASRADRNAGGMAENTHPTVKPTDLMRWLVRLVTPPGGIVLDPFAGSGTTLVAARAEGVRAVGIEREDEYARIIADRLAQLSLFTEGME
jgi:site-specific DNA-methyltransferase (adenine-specific)